ncbi:leucine-rich repeat-containing protein 73-like [Ostrea edulis]|uniref:leucine-rich repeat-containing protein 73-like n=1 Tax=Ostrea edulis TaxID=37623 RepID=UPI0024AF1D70|nr:leucine-rich repeat-containing protein 73-like [Ostrea edulis]
MKGTIEFSHVIISDENVKEICDAANGEKLKTLSLRDCEIDGTMYNSILKAVGACKSILQLSLCVGMVKTKKDVSALCKCLQKNRSLLALFIHGNPLKDSGMQRICREMAQHPHIVSLDASDCELTDQSMEDICNLLPKMGTKSGLKDLSLSANPGISQKSWGKFGVSLAANSNLRELYLDYNNLGDYAASCIVVGLSGSQNLQVLDLEGTNINGSTAELIQHLLKNFPTQLRKVVLKENKINSSIIEKISSCLEESDDISDTFSIESMKLKTKSSGKTFKSKSSTQKSSTLKDGTREEASSSDDDREKEEESDMKDTVKTDEDYRVLEMALEEGLSTGKISALSGTMEDDDIEEELTEVPLTSSNHVIRFTENKPLTYSAEEFPDDGDELKEVPVLQLVTV